MKFARNLKAITRLSLILLMLISFVIGAFLSYLWVMGGVIELGIKIPDKTTVAITNVAFAPQNTNFFNLTLLNPSYSPSKAEITEITTSTDEGTIHTITTANPSLPHQLLEGTDQTFQCFWNWANYTGQTIGISAFVANGSGPTFEAPTPFVGLVTNLHFDSSISVTQFNLTIQSHENSVTHVNITDIKAQTESLETEDVSPSLPYRLNPNSSVTFTCLWDWSDHQNTSITIAVYTAQGYVSYATQVTPNPVVLEVTDVLFNELDTNHFNITIRNSELSPSYLNISRIALTPENETMIEINGTEMEPSLPYSLDQGSSMTFQCSWNWNPYRNKNVTISVHTLQNYTIYYTTATPSPIEIINAIFDPGNTDSFNVTVQNSEFYTTHVNLTEITLLLENGTTESIDGTETTPQLPYTLEPDSTTTFICPWNWFNYQNKNITITVCSTENYTAQLTKVTPTRVSFAIVGVVFDPIDTTTFTITVRNSEFSLDDAQIAKIAVTLENGTVTEISDVLPVLPYTLASDSTAVFQCTWNWTNYRNKNITITVHTSKGYIAASQYTSPPASQLGQ
ncbi:MAG: hypothetical protein OEX77_01590 [Candidatus Bathyarchaeota archaeon]|nr:hypothetical protein [Candidatus Bathyarchaeota archaeon]